MAEINTTFNELCAELNLSENERIALVWHLAQFRLRKTVEALLPATTKKVVPASTGQNND